MQPGDLKSETTPPPPVPAGYTNVDPDPLKSKEEYAVPPYGMKIDRKFYEHFEDKVKADTTLRGYYERGNIRAAEDYVRQWLFDKPRCRCAALPRKGRLEKIRGALGWPDSHPWKDNILEMLVKPTTPI